MSGATTQAQADDALARLLSHGWEPDTNLLHASHWLFASPAIAVTCANAHGRFRVSDNLCGFSFGAGNGVPPTGVIQVVWNNSVGGAKNHTASTSPSSHTLDFAFDGANCLRQLWKGGSANTTRVKAGIAAVQRSANLRGKPALIVHGRSDTLVPVSFSSRPCVLRNTQVEGAASKLRYVEVTNAQHFDSFLPVAGDDIRYIPLHPYYIRAMDAMWAQLKNGSAARPPGGAHDAARRHPGRGERDHRGQRAGHRGPPACGRSHHGDGDDAEHSRLRARGLRARARNRCSRPCAAGGSPAQARRA